MNPLPLVGFRIGIRILRPFKGRGFINHGSTSEVGGFRVFEGFIGIVWGLYGDHGKEHGSYFRV